MRTSIVNSDINKNIKSDIHTRAKRDKRNRKQTMILKNFAKYRY